jgi:hypothetical protein
VLAGSGSGRALSRFICHRDSEVLVLSKSATRVRDSKFASL